MSLIPILYAIVCTVIYEEKWLYFPVLCTVFRARMGTWAGSDSATLHTLGLAFGEFHVW